MLMLTCPLCGVTAEETEFHAGGEAHLRRAGPGSDDAEFAAYMFGRANPKGAHLERWRHAYGCGKWFIVARDTASLRILGSYPAQTLGPPPDILAAVDAAGLKLGGNHG